MASGQTLIVFQSTDNNPPTTLPATPDLRNTHPVLDFDAGQAEVALFAGRLPRFYGGAGVTISLMWTATTAISGSVQWAAAIERHDPATDLDADSFGPVTNAALAATNTGGAGRPTYTDLVIPVASMDGLVAGEHFRLKVTRLVGGAMAGDAELWSVEIRET